MIVLYVKKHNVTGLKYFGKTESESPEKYKGSGRYWRSHLRKHGSDVSTVETWIFDNIADASEFAIKFSTENKIVESTEWANEIIENAIDGWPKGTKRGPQTIEQKQKTSELLSGDKNPMYGKTRPSDFMTSIGLIGIERQRELREQNQEWAEKEKQKWYQSWENNQRKQEHRERFTGHAPAMCSVTRQYLGLVSTSDPRWETEEICSPQKGIKRGQSRARGKPKLKTVCRLIDRKEMDKANFIRWLKKHYE